jgi:hypothetical protein
LSSKCGCNFARISWASKFSFTRNLMIILYSSSTCRTGKCLPMSYSELFKN